MKRSQSQPSRDLVEKRRRRWKRLNWSIWRRRRKRMMLPRLQQKKKRGLLVPVQSRTIEVLSRRGHEKPEESLAAVASATRSSVHSGASLPVMRTSVTKARSNVSRAGPLAVRIANAARATVVRRIIPENVGRPAAERSRGHVADRLLGPENVGTGLPKVEIIGTVARPIEAASHDGGLPEAAVDRIEDTTGPGPVAIGGEVAVEVVAVVEEEEEKEGFIFPTFASSMSLTNAVKGIVVKLDTLKNVKCVCFVTGWRTHPANLVSNATERIVSSSTQKAIGSLLEIVIATTGKSEAVAAAEAPRRQRRGCQGKL